MMLRLGLSAIFAALCLAGCQTYSVSDRAETTAPDAAEEQPITPQVLGAGEMLEIRYPGAPELNARYEVSEDGVIELPYLGVIDVRAETLQSLAERITAAMRSELRHPRVEVYSVGATPCTE